MRIVDETLFLGLDHGPIFYSPTILFILHYTLLKHYLCDLRDEIEREESEGKREIRFEVR